MFGRFSSVLQSALEVVAPPASLLHEFTYHWKKILKFYINRNSINKVSIESTNIPRHLDELLKILIEEEESVELGATGPCLEYLLHHHLLDLLATLSCTDCPSGMKQFTFTFVRKLITQIKQPILPHISVYVPVQRMVGLCNGSRASPTEYHEITFLCSLCAVVSKYPQLICVFTNQNISERRSSTNIVSTNGSELKGKYSEDLANTRDASCLEKVEDGEIDETLKNSVLLKPLPHCKRNQFESGQRTNRSHSSEVDSLSCFLPELQISEAIDHSDTVGSNYQLIDALLSFFHSADSMITIKACEGIMVIASLSSDGFAHWVVQHSNLCMVLATQLQTLYAAIPLDIDPNDLDDIQVNWGLDTPIWSDGALSPGCRQVAVFLSWLDYCDQLVREAHPITGSSIAQAIREHFLEKVFDPEILHGDVNKVMTTAFISKCLKQTSAPALLTEFIHWLIGTNREPELPGVTTYPIRQQLLDNCLHEDHEISLETLRLFEVLLEKYSEHVFHTLIFTYLNARSYYNNAYSTTIINSWSDEEDEREKLRDGALLDFSLSSSPVNRTLSPSNVHKIINCFLFLLPLQMHSATDPDESGYEHYIQDADRQYQICITRCSHFKWPSEATFLEENEDDDSSSSDSRPEADHEKQFYEGPFLRMLFTRLLRLPYQPYAINLQLTGLVSRLAMLPHPYLHEFILNPMLPVRPEVSTLFNILQEVSKEIVQLLPLISDYKQLLHVTRQKLLGDSVNAQEESNSLLESFIVLEEFSKELAAVTFVKYHHST